MASFWAQYSALCRKNYIVLSTHWAWSTIKCFLLPVAFTVLYAISPVIFASNKTPDAAQRDRDQENFSSLVEILLAPALMVPFLPLIYHLPGAFASERSSLLTSHLQSMGLRNAPRILSWLTSFLSFYTPSLIIQGLLYRVFIYTQTSVWILLLLVFLTAFSLASWSLLLAAPLGRSPILAANIPLLLAFGLSILPLVTKFTFHEPGVMFLIVVLLPPTFFSYTIRAVSEFKELEIHTNILNKSPKRDVVILACVIGALVNTIIYPFIAVVIEHYIFDARGPNTEAWWWFSKRPTSRASSPNIELTNISKIFSSKTKTSSGQVVAIQDLSLSVPSRGGITVLLGPNGAGKSTTIALLAGLLAPSSGNIALPAGYRNSLGVVPQKNVLWDELSVQQTLALWGAIKSKGGGKREEVERLIAMCDLTKCSGKKAGVLSGGQKRKLQLGIGIVGGSKTLLVDECTSGVDVLSRRALWRALTSIREDTTIIFTTHFLDEADLLGDTLVILDAPGKLIASGSPVGLKRTFGRGYTLSCSRGEVEGVLDVIRSAGALDAVSTGEGHYRLGSEDPAVVGSVLSALERTGGEMKWAVKGATIEEVFLRLMEGRKAILPGGAIESHSPSTTTEEKAPEAEPNFGPLNLSRARPASPFSQALTIYRKRALLLTKSWFGTFVTLCIAWLGSSLPLLLPKAGIPELPVSCVNDPISTGWALIFVTAMSLYPAFFAIYPARERRSGVQSLQASNGLSNTLGLWMGHFMFDATLALVVVTVISIIYAAAAPGIFGQGLLWLTMLLYSLSSILVSYICALLTSSPIAAWSLSTTYQFVAFIIYFFVAFSVSTNVNQNAIFFGLGLGAPIISLTRAAFTAVNTNNILCRPDFDHPFTVSGSGEVLPNVIHVHPIGDIREMGGPILYLVFWPIVLFAIILYVTSGFRARRVFSQSLHRRQIKEKDVEEEAAHTIPLDVVEENRRVNDPSTPDPLRVLGVSKTFPGSKKNKGGQRKPAVDDVSFGVSDDMIFALLGPNGAGKTTTFNMIRGALFPDSGEVLVNNMSITSSRAAAALCLGVCPQFSAFDGQLSVRQHLAHYGRLKGLHGTELAENVEALIRGCGLTSYKDRAASKLSGGNMKKLSLAIALMGRPAVVLVDEFSTGIDPATKRELWKTLRAVSPGTAMVITTHSMEEASALSNRVAIIASQMLAIGTPDELAARLQVYEVHFSCRSPSEQQRVTEIMTLFPGSKQADDVATRFEVPIGQTGLSRVFGVLNREAGGMEFQVEEASLESVFCKIVRAHEFEGDE